MEMINRIRVDVPFQKKNKQKKKSKGSAFFHIEKNKHLAYRLKCHFVLKDIDDWGKTKKRCIEKVTGTAGHRVYFSELSSCQVKSYLNVILSNTTCLHTQIHSN